MNLLRKFIKASPTDEIANIPMGKFFLARGPSSPKGALECLFNDCMLSMRRTTKPFCYQLSVTRAYQEGEASSQSTGEFEDGEDDENNNETERNSDERVFFLTEDLGVHLVTKNDGSHLITWKDVNGDEGETLQFVVDEETKFNDVEGFMRTLYSCLYEQKYGKSSLGVPEKALLSEFGTFSPPPKTQRQSSLESLRQLESEALRENRREVRNMDKRDTHESDSEDDTFGDASSIPFFIFKPSVPLVGTLIDSFQVQLRIFDPVTDSFALVLLKADIKLMESILFSLVSVTPDFSFLVPVAQEMNPVFNVNNLAFIFNYYSFDEKGHGNSYSLLFQFSSINDFYRFGHHFQEAMSKSLNPNVKSSDADYAYLTSMVKNMDLGSSSEDDSSSESEGEDTESEGARKIIGSKKCPLFVPSDSKDEDDAENEQRFLRLKDPNSGLAVGNANDRSYVTRGDNLGVFKQDDNGLQFVSTIEAIKDIEGKKFVPKSNMLYQRDNFLLMTKECDRDNSIYKMDLSRGQIVEAWDVQDKGVLETFAPMSKFAPLTNEQKLLGATSNSLFHIDPRLSGSKVVGGDSYKAYKTKTAFETMAVTDKGYIVVGSKDGTIRLYERFGKRSTVSLPSFGEHYLGLDVTKDGRWVVATCQNSLLLIDTKVGSGQKNAGEIGFKKYFDADKKPVPKRLSLLPEHVSLITHATGNGKIGFTRAVFNTSLTEEETVIVTSTGPFVISWSLKDIVKKWTKVAAYKINRHKEDVVMESFAFSSQNDIFAALQSDVVSTKRTDLKVANKSSIMNHH